MLPKLPYFLTPPPAVPSNTIAIFFPFLFPRKRLFWLEVTKYASTCEASIRHHGKPADGGSVVQAGADEQAVR